MSVQDATVDHLYQGLASARLLADLPEADLRTLTAAAEERRYIAGDVVFREGEPSDGLYFVLTGALRIVTHLRSGETVLANVPIGECVGEMGVIDRLPRSATASAATFAILAFVPGEAFLALLERSPKITMRLVKMLSERLRRTNAFVAELPGRLTRAEPTLEP